jgi:hypothetical protein
MKKKVALLLAFVMVLSLLPMNVFGRGSVSAPQEDPGTHTYTVLINGADLANRANADRLFLEFELHGGVSRAATGAATRYTNVVRFGHNPATAWDNADHADLDLPALNNVITFSGAFAGGLTTAMNTSVNISDAATATTGAALVSSRRILVPLYHSSGTNNVMDDLATQPSSILTATIDIRAGARAAELSVRIVEQVGANLIEVVPPTRAPLVLPDRPGGVTIDVAGIVPVGPAARIEPITITERHPHNLDNSVPFAVQLVAPRGFRWETGGLVGTGSDGLRVRSSNEMLMAHPAEDNADLIDNGDVTTDPITGVSGVAVRHHALNAAQRDVLVIEILTNRHTGSVLQDTTAAQLRIEELVLVATTYAPTSGNVNIDVEMGVWAVETRAGVDSAGNWITLPSTAPNIPMPEGFPREAAFIRNTSVPNQAARADAYPTAPIPRFFTPGTTSDRNAGRAGVNWESMALTVGERGIVGAVIVTGPEETYEFLSGRLTAGRTGGTAPAWLNRNDPSIRIQETVPGAILRQIDNYEFRAPEGVRFVDVRYRMGDSRENGVYNIAPWTSVTVGNTDHILVGLTELDANVLRFAPRPRDTIVSYLRHIDLGFQLSIEAGFENRHGSEIEIEVFRNGQFIGSEVVATVVDPVRVSTTSPVVLERTQLDIIPLMTIPAVTLTENMPGALRQGEQIWVYLAATQGGVVVPVVGEMNLVIPNPPVIINPESGLHLRPLGTGLQRWGQEPQETGLPDNRVYAFAFEVVSASRDIPGSITFSGAATGWLVPGIEYQFVVGGPAVTETSHHVVPQYRADLDTAFTSLPYSVTVLDVRGEAHVYGGIVDPGVIEPVDTLVMSTATASMATNVRDAFGNRVAVNVAAPFVQGDTAMMIAMRAFAHHIDAVLIWDGSTSTATISGRHFVSGQPMSVAVQLNNPMAQITVGGTTFGQDIASFGGHFLSGPAGTVMPILIDNLNYLPARFMAEVFGLVVDWNAATMTATIRMP